jgi:branched-chain amino acid transport system substrate-binding protein
MKKIFYWFVIFVASLCFMSMAQAAETIKIGVLYAMSGPQAVQGMEAVRGMQIAAKVQNERGGVLGKKIDLVFGDAKDVSATVAEAERMAAVEKVVAICGSTLSSAVIASSSVSEKYGIIYWVATAVSNEINERGFKYIFKVDPNAEELGRTQVRYAVEAIGPLLGLEPSEIKLGLVWENSALGTGCSEGVRLEAKDRRIQIVSDHPYSFKTNDLSSVIMRLKAEKPNILVPTTYLNDCILLTKQSQTLGFKVKAIVGIGGYNMIDWKKAVGDLGEGACVVGYLNENINPAHLGDIGITKFYDLYKDMFKQMPTGAPYMVSTYTGLMALVDVIKRAGSTDTESLRRAAIATDIPDGKTLSGYGIKFHPPGHKRAGLNMRAYFYMQQWQDGVLYTLGPKGAAMPGRTIKKP